jgi:hypothetical protein
VLVICSWWYKITVTVELAVAKAAFSLVEAAWGSCVHQEIDGVR